ncbi:MAG: polyprenol monophosphomannose synthase [Deltaproteobacteria bacterium]|nr:polyprenol monophosphomannose synthase [Deltaproteobacteria bacterium]
MCAKSLIIVPTYNERDNIEALAEQALSQLDDAHLLFVDDNSPDGTGDLADQMAKNDARIEVLHRSGKLGLGTAYIAGFRYGLERDYRFLIEMDADFSHLPEYLPQLLHAAETRGDIAVGSRYTAGGGTVNWGIGRQLISRGGNAYARMVLGLSLSDMTSGFKCFRREVLESIDLDAVRSNGYSFQIEMTYRAVRRGFSIAEVPIVFHDRRVGQSKMSRAIVAEAMWMVWRLRLGLVDVA